MSNKILLSLWSDVKVAVILVNREASFELSLSDTSISARSMEAEIRRLFAKDVGEEQLAKLKASLCLIVERIASRHPVSLRYFKAMAKNLDKSLIILSLVLQ